MTWLAFPVPAEGNEELTTEGARMGRLALENMIQGNERVLRIADRIRLASADLCKKQSPVLGVSVFDPEMLKRSFSVLEPFQKAMKSALQERIGWDGRKRVLTVQPDMPAARAGLQPGDVVLKVNGKTLRRKEVLDALKLNKSRRKGLNLTVNRGDEMLDIAVDLEVGCGYPAFWVEGSTVNAYARLSSDTNMFQGMLDLFPDDDDIAIIQGHELAHIIIDRWSTKDSEAEADYVGLYLAARAGFDISSAAAVWSEMGERNPYSSIDWGFYSHPSSPQRRLAVQATVDEIAAKRAAGNPLTPGEQPRPGEQETEFKKAETRVRAFARLQAKRQRLLDVSYRLRKGAIEFCGDKTAPALGASIGRRRDVLRGHKEEAEEAFGLVDEVRVMALTTNSPGMRPSLKTGDLVLRVNGRMIDKSGDVFEALRARPDRNPRVTVARDGVEIEIEIDRDPACHHNALLIMGSSVNTATHSNREDLLVPSSLLDFVETDDELAISIAHQIAHDLLGTSLAIEATREYEADRLGLQLAYAAGFDISDAPALMDRHVLNAPWKLGSKGWRKYSSKRRAHAGYITRSLEIRRTIAEILEDAVPAGN
ncbi:MAG: PDZ domain-containing protein [bacterium]|nr:PDZ domain-containing protein [bacterium]